MNQGRHKNQLRIIGGQWRGRKLSFPDIQALRPTPDRVRETLFNWLQPIIRDARCLDLFAGSGALGLEALSRGASAAIMVELDARIIASLRVHIDSLQANATQLVHTDALTYLQHAATEGPFDIVFLDPPFRHNLLEPCCQLLEQHGWLKPQARIYLEAESELELTALPQNWHITHSKQAGEVRYYMAIRDIPQPPKTQGEK